MVEENERKKRILQDIIQINREKAQIHDMHPFKREICQEKNNALRRLYEELQEINKITGYRIPQPNEKNYEYPNNEIIKTLKLEHYTIEGMLPSITNCGDEPLFYSSLIENANKYLIMGKYPYTLMVSSDQNSDKKDASILATMDTNFLLNGNSAPYLRLLSKFIKKYTGENINLILTDEKLKEITFARISDEEFFRNHLGEKLYYYYFTKLFEDYIRNVIYIGEGMKKNAPDEEIEKAERDFIQKDQEIIVCANAMSDSELEDFNRKVKRKILKYKP